LKSDLDVSAYSPTNRVILNTLKNVGAILADNGEIGFSGSPDPRWDDQELALSHSDFCPTSTLKLSIPRVAW
jgi:hypothetical protein